MASTTTTPPTPAPSLQEATKASTAVWQQDLESLFHHAKDRFPDVVWELDQDEEVYGHKAIVYARAPPSFQNRYFARGGESTAALVYSEDGYPAESTLTLADPAPQQQQQQQQLAGPPAPTLLRLTSDISPALFANELEYLYTGKGFGEAFEFLFDAEHTHTHTHSGGGGSAASIVSADEPEHAEALRIDKLRKDLVFMWRSRLYSDVRIALTGNFSAGAGHEATTAIFSSHRFVLVSRSSYFYDALLAWPRPPSSSPSYALSSSVSSAGGLGPGPGEQPTLTLPSPPFTPASVHFTLGFLYTGTLIFSHRSYDLSTAFAILRAALYLGIPTLHDEIQARIAAEMLHGLFHAFLPFPAYEALTQGRWGTGGCRCRQCARRAPRVLELAVAPDVQNVVLERGARRALVGLFGEGWATQEFAQLPQKLRESLLKGVAKRTTGENALGLLYAAEHALRRLGSAVEPWADVVRDAVLTARGKVDEVVAREAEVVFATDEWEAVLEGGGDHFEDSERVEWTMASVLRGVRDDCAPVLYQTLVSSILLRPHPTEPSAPLLPATSNIRVQVEQTRMELLKWFGKNWLNVRQARGFDPLEGWSLKEISDHIEVSIDDLLSPPSYSSPAKRSQAHLHPHSRPTSAHPHPHPHTSRADVASESASMRVSVLSRVAGSAAGASQRGSGAASPRHTNNNNNNALSSGRGSSVYSLARSTASSVSVRSAATASTISAMPRVHSPVGAGAEGERMSPARRIAEDARRSMARSLSEKERPDSKFVDDEIVGGVQAPSIVLPPGEAEAEVGADEEASGFGDEASEGGDGEDEEGGDEGDGQSDAASTGPGGTRPLVVGPKKTVVSRASSRASMASTTPSRRTPVAATGPKKISPSTQRIKGEEREGVRTRTTSAASSVSLSPSVRTKTAAGSPGRGSTTTKGRLSVKTTTKAGAVGITSPRAPPRTPSTATLSRPTSRVSTHSTRSVSGGAARPESSASGTGTSDSYRTASAGSASSPVSTRKSVSTAGTRSRTTSTASTSTMSTLSRRTVSTATASTASGSGPATPASRGAPRLSAGSAAAASDRKRRVSGASVASSVSVASASPSTRSTAPRATPVRKTVSAGAEKDKQHLSPAAAVAAKARGKAPVGGTPKKVGSSASVGAVPSPGSGPVARTRKITGKKEKEKEPEPDAESSDTGEGEGDETVVMAAPPVLDADDQDNTITLPPPEADKENQTPATGAVAVEDNDKDTKLAGDEPSPAKTTTSTSTVTVRPGMRDLARVGGDTEHKKTASSASSSSVSTLRRKGSNDTIRTVKSSGLASVSTPSSQAQALPAQSSPAPAPAPAPTTAQPPPTQPPAQAHASPSARPASPPAVATAARHPTSIDHILAQTAPQGATLEIGIPCIISSKRKRFKAYARYIGEVLGESGPWVGVEVPLPLGDAAWAWGDESFVSSGSMGHSQHMTGAGAGSGFVGPRDDRAWHDGSWGGVRYFEIGGGVGGSEWEYGYAGGESDRAARRRRLEGGGSWWSSGGGGASGIGGGAGSGSGIGAGGGTKREGDSLSIASERMKRMRSVSPAHSDVSGGTESRGLFVRPQQVLYVVDAVGADF